MIECIICAVFVSAMIYMVYYCRQKENIKRNQFNDSHPYSREIERMNRRSLQGKAISIQDILEMNEKIEKWRQGLQA